ncbi:MAG: hypothetical protein K6G68_07850 [Oscillospiraceae bacterium]|nr:hypothetical protein [Oscillospiraceae bacterium]
MRAQVRELSQQQTDMRQTAETLRILQKKYDSLEKECETKGEAYQKLADESALKEEAYRKSAELIEFYNNMVSIASRFPTNKNDIGEWIDEYFSDDLITASRALNELRKYSGSLDVAALCDGLVYLAEYAKYRRQEIGEDVLELYAQRCHWDIQGCGKEALKMHRDEYTVNIDGAQYLLDQHIKRGIHAEELIRIYFCWDAKCRKVIVGSMPEHLATVKNST